MPRSAGSKNLPRSVQGYARYLDTTVRGFLEEESARAQNEHREYLVKLFVAELEELETLG